jgi:TonB family protein
MWCSQKIRHSGGNGDSEMKVIVWAIFIINLCGCVAYPLVNQNKYSSLEKVNEGLIDSSSVDFTNWEIVYNNYLKKINPTNRTYSTINEVLQKNDKAILESCYKYADMMSIKIIDTVWFGLSPKGNLRITSINSKALPDFFGLKRLNEILTKVHFDESKVDTYSCRFSILIRSNNTSQSIKLNPSITYGESERTKDGIWKTIKPYLRNMKCAYFRRLSTKPGIRGKLTVKFAVDQYGLVIFAKKLESTLSDELLDSACIQQIQHWKFDPILAKNNVTEFVYPFLFSQ